MATWSKENILEFIEIYRSHECLWKVKSKHYSNRLVKERAYQQLIDFVRNFDSEANKEAVMKKISNLRGSFRKELKKVEGSLLSGAGADDVYQPKLWYFANLAFLRDQEVSRSTCSSLEISPTTSTSQEIPDATVVLETQNIEVG